MMLTHGGGFVESGLMRWWSVNMKQKSGTETAPLFWANNWFVASGAERSRDPLRFGLIGLLLDGDGALAFAGAEIMEACAADAALLGDLDLRHLG